MKRVTGIGGIFFKTNDAKAMNEWYKKHLGFKQAGDNSILFEWRNTDTPEEKNYTVWSPFKNDTKYFEPSQKDYMINLRVENLEALMEELKKEGVQIASEIEKFEYGKFASIIDPEGNKIELWEPVDSEFTKLYEGNTIH
ncbi:MAG TPA: VOC family protein [Chitinophagaceae bacterium]|nr:VOC family protein [Chitinophagaceae bacterium]